MIGPTRELVYPQIRRTNITCLYALNEKEKKSKNIVVGYNFLYAGNINYMNRIENINGRNGVATVVDK